MSVVVLLLVVGLFMLWRLRRRARATELAGRDSARPTFAVEPPQRRLGARKDGVL